MADRIKVYEEKSKKSVAIWAWLLPLLLVLALIFYFATRQHHPEAEDAANAALPAAQSTAGALPDLGTVKFATNQAALTSEDQAVLDRAAVAMKNNANAHIRIEGFTDSTGTVQHNLTLSQQRAAAVASYLKSKGIDGSRLTGGGFGPDKPADTNATAAGKADNRRVELFSQQ